MRPVSFRWNYTFLAQIQRLNYKPFRSIDKWISFFFPFVETTIRNKAIIQTALWSINMIHIWTEIQRERRIKMKSVSSRNQVCCIWWLRFGKRAFICFDLNGKTKLRIKPNALSDGGSMYASIIIINGIKWLWMVGCVVYQKAHLIKYIYTNWYDLYDMIIERIGRAHG